MDISDRIESQVPLVAIPEHLVFALEEWIAEEIRQACDCHDGPEDRRAVIKAVHCHDALLGGTLTPAQTAELAEGAAGWLVPQWPTNAEDADEVEHLVGVTRELLELRDRARAVALNNANTPHVITIASGTTTRQPRDAVIGQAS